MFPANASKSLETLIVEIRSLKPQLESLIPQFRRNIERVEAASGTGSATTSSTYWTLVAFADSLVRVRLFLEQNFNFVETVGVLAVTRYLFELTVWLKLLQMDCRCGLVYYGELLKQQLDFYTQLRDNAMREVSFLGKIGSQEETLLKRRLEDAMQISDEETRKLELGQLGNNIMHEIDQAASRSFSLYAEQAQTNGYGYQAHLIETKVIPGIAKTIADIEQKLATFDSDLPAAIRSLVPYTWKKRARKVNMQGEYDFIYAYTSRLLHATPASLTTNEKNLEPAEMRTFLKYIRVRLLDVIDMAKGGLTDNSTTIH